MEISMKSNLLKKRLGKATNKKTEVNNLEEILKVKLIKIMDSKHKEIISRVRFQNYLKND